jgi:hypothetical protein
MTVLVVLLAVVVALVLVLVAGLLRSHAEILRALQELGVDLESDAPRSAIAPVPRPKPGAPDSAREAKDITGVSPTGDGVRVAVVDVPGPTLLAFLTSGCTTCVGFWNTFAAPGRLAAPGGARVVVVTKGEEAESPGRLRRFTTNDIPVVMSSEAWSDYDVPVAPYFAYVDGATGRVVGEGAAATWDHLVGMMEQALADAGIEQQRSRRRRSGPERAERIDSQLRASGIEPGDPRLYPQTVDDLSAPEVEHHE